MTEAETRTDTGRRLQQITQGSLLWLWAAALTVGLTLVLSFNLVSRTQVSVTVGEPANQDVVAPQSISYFSDVLTDQAREQAMASVDNVYTTPDLIIARAQVNQARAIFNFIDVVRADSMAGEETKLGYLSAIEGVTIDAEIGQMLLAMSGSDYEAVKADVINIIEEVMRREIRDDSVAVNEARRAARNQFSFNLTQSQERVVTSIVPQFVVPNSFFNEEATTERRSEAAEAVEPQRQSVLQGQYIIRVGEEVTPAHMEMLERLGLLQPEISWWGVGSIFMAVVLVVSLLTLYWHRFHSSLQESPRYLLLFGAIILLFVLGAKLLVPGQGMIAYLFPTAAMSMLLAVIYDERLAIFSSVTVAVLVGLVAQESLELTFYMAIGPLFAALTLRDAQRINAFFRAGLVAALANMLVILVFRMSPDVAPVEILQLLAFSIGNGLISASITLAGFFVVGSVFGMMTTLQLQELSRLDHPLLKDLLRRAPGTYHHSIMVANLAEQAAERVRANSALVRVGAFYHDIGKMNRPPFFTENQEGIDPHDTLDPYSSARIIISHVQDGLQLARKHRLPDRIQDFIAEHHGDRLVLVFFKKAQEQAEDGATVDEARFHYSGPRPRSRESGIVLLADSVEAASAAVRPNNGESIEKLVNKIVEDHIKEGQLDNSDLTLGDIREIRESFIETLKGRFHVRVKYPGNEELAPLPDTPVVPGPQTEPERALPRPLSRPALTRAGRGDS
ncbi:MAG TPA: HDIG domain-containing protein [Candidatus Sulfomarinibacteraceae bacterium]|nr:HDIG domain-containing protein [Candidatus Sulfomarinibacteraceae bacterium]